MKLENGILLNNRYRIINMLAQGGMGAIYHAVDEHLEIDVAIKENLFKTEEYARQFRLEATILANLRHPNLPRVTDYFVADTERQYLVMDYVAGEDLRQRILQNGAISESSAIAIGAAICDTLTYLHSKNPSILHRDIKPGNIKITPDGHVFLVDFGLAKVVNDQATEIGARAMTPGYSPPEQYGNARTDPRSDIYSLAATLYTALSGILPEDGLTRVIGNSELTPLQKRNSKISHQMAATIEKALEIEPNSRYQTASDFKKSLLSSWEHKDANCQSARHNLGEQRENKLAGHSLRSVSYEGRKVKTRVTHLSSIVRRSMGAFSSGVSKFIPSNRRFVVLYLMSIAIMLGFIRIATQISLNKITIQWPWLLFSIGDLAINIIILSAVINGLSKTEREILGNQKSVRLIRAEKIPQPVENRPATYNFEYSSSPLNLEYSVWISTVDISNQAIISDSLDVQLPIHLTS